jgi:predicted metal-dependent hydrolase
MPQIKYKDKFFEYEIVKKKNKNISICITPDGVVRVTSPSFVTDSYVHEVVYKRAAWILSNLENIKETTKGVLNRRYSRGDRAVYLGKEYDLKVIEEVEVENRIRFNGEEFEVHVDPEGDEEEREKSIREGLAEWYKHEAFRKFKERTRFYSEILKLYPNNIRVKEQKTLWGSCSSKDNINFNWKLIMAPQAVLDYIVVHELCHLKHRDHSKNYWNLVEQIIPDHKEKRKWLKENGRSLVV